MVDDFRPRRRMGKHDNTPQWQRPAQFQTPEAIAADEERRNQPTQATPLIGGAALHGAAHSKRSFKERLASLSKKQWILIAAVAIVVLGGGGAAAFALLSSDDPAPKKQAVVKDTPEAPAKPTTVPSKLTGLPVDPSFNERQVTAVMIENSTDARPQSGLNEAGVVFEAVAEGGITRFTALFQDTAPDYVGPVRSVRPYYIQWIRGFDAAVAHVGGSGDALAMLKRGEAKDLDQFTNPGPFRRVSNRFAPHNMYTSIAGLQELQTKRGYNKSTYTAIPRNTKESPSAAPTARSIDFTISSPLYNSHYDYDQATNTYKRSEGGKPHTDERSGAQLAPKVVVGLVMPQGRNGIYTTYQTIGSGAAYVFQDGIVTQGTWHKTSNESNFTFTDASGAELKLNPGQTWFSVVGGTDRVKYAP
jgi:hypothetical protein